MLAAHRSHLTRFGAIPPVDEASRAAAYRRLDVLTKPRGCTGAARAAGRPGVRDSRNAGHQDRSPGGYRVRCGPRLSRNAASARIRAK